VPSDTDQTHSTTHQEAHEVEGEDGGHTAKGQALKYGAPDAGRVAVFLGRVAGQLRGAGPRARACLGSPDAHG